MRSSLSWAVAIMRISAVEAYPVPLYYLARPGVE